MKKAKEWFLGLSRIGKASIIGVLLFGAMTASGSQQSAPFSTNPNSSPTGTTTNVRPLNDPVITYDTVVETKPVPFERQSTEDDSMAKGTSVVRVPGQNGIVTVTHRLTLRNGEEIDRKTTEETTKAPINEVTAIGTYVEPAQQCDTNYSGCVPIVGYDLDCPDIGFSVIVYGYDRHGFDRDRDGYGCESY